MAEVNTVRCDVCGTQKKEVNHWWKGVVSPKEVTFIPAEAFFPNGGQIFDLCGYECAAKWLGQQMEKL